MEEGHPTPQPLLDKPELAPHLQAVWRAFSLLRGDRQIGMGGEGPLSFAAIDRYAIRYRITSIDEFERFHSLLMAMDAVYCAPKPVTEIQKSPDHG